MLQLAVYLMIVIYGFIVLALQKFYSTDHRSLASSGASKRTRYKGISSIGNSLVDISFIGYFTKLVLKTTVLWQGH